MSPRAGVSSSEDSKGDLLRRSSSLKSANERFFGRGAAGTGRAGARKVVPAGAIASPSVGLGAGKLRWTSGEAGIITCGGEEGRIGSFDLSEAREGAICVGWVSWTGDDLGIIWVGWVKYAEREPFMSVL